jgi:hypothetical protein
VEQGKIKAAEIDPARLALLEVFPDAGIRARAVKLFAGTKPSQRADVLASAVAV